MFASNPTESAIGPLRLDSGVEVPSSINKFLREYQRDGVQFFYERWKEGRGGVLGDDMGLVRYVKLSFFLYASVSAIML